MHEIYITQPRLDVFIGDIGISPLGQHFCDQVVAVPVNLEMRIQEGDDLLMIDGYFIIPAAELLMQLLRILP